MNDKKRDEVIETGLDVVEVPVAAVPIVGGAINALVEAGRHRRYRRAFRLLQTAIEEHGLRLDRLEELEADEESTELLDHALRAAMDSRTEEKLDLLAAVLADGLAARTDRNVERSHLLLNLLATLEGVHIAVLSTIGVPHPGAGPLDGLMVTGLNRDGIALLRPDLEQVVDPVLASLESQGLVQKFVTTADVNSPEVFQLTELGSWLLTTLEGRNLR